MSSEEILRLPWWDDDGGEDPAIAAELDRLWLIIGRGIFLQSTRSQAQQFSAAVIDLLVEADKQYAEHVETLGPEAASKWHYEDLVKDLIKKVVEATAYDYDDES